ncbi:hypothetical protein OHR68_43390 [Spirillospora sp. NBC_00431]
MIDGSLSRTVIAVGVVIAAVMFIGRHLTRRVTTRQSEVLGLLRTLLVQLRMIAHIKKLEVELLELQDQDPAALGRAADRSPEESVDAIIAEIKAGPYLPHRIHPGLPPGSRITVSTPDGPVMVAGPAHAPRAAGRRRRARHGARHGFQGVGALSAVLGTIWRGLATSAQTGAAAALTLGPAVPMPPAQASDQPPAIVRPSHGQDVHSQPLPAFFEPAPAEPIRQRRIVEDEEKDSVSPSPEVLPSPSAPPAKPKPPPGKAPGEAPPETSPTTSTSPSPSPTGSALEGGADDRAGTGMAQP